MLESVVVGDNYWKATISCSHCACLVHFAAPNSEVVTSQCMCGAYYKVIYKGWISPGPGLYTVDFEVLPAPKVSSK